MTAIDGRGNVWVTNFGNGSVTEITGFGSSATYANYSGFGPTEPGAMAIDGSGNAWVADSQTGIIAEISGSGASASYTRFNTGLAYIGTMAIDGSGNAWMVDMRADILELLGVATPVVTPITAGGGGTTARLGVRP